MSNPSNAREALIAEVLGDAATLLDRVDSASHALDAACEAMSQASAKLDAQAAALDSRLAALTEAAKVHAVQHIARRADEAARRAIAIQTQALEAAGHAIFEAELRPALQQLGTILDKRATGSSPLFYAWFCAAMMTTAVASAIAFSYLILGP